VSLTTGRAPLSADPAGRFDRPVPVGAVYVEPFLRRVRAVDGRRTVIDSERVVRVDCLRARRRLRVELASAVLVDTADVTSMHETSRAPQLYVRPEAVRMDLLVPSRTVTYCPYKGTATHWTAAVGDMVVPEVAWSYDDPLPECTAIAGLLSFYPERVTMLQVVLTWFAIPAADPNNSHG
jgi:uncharacterized protein (DUF427 family)